MSIEILEPGLLTLVVDGGRFGYRRLGIPPSDAMDLYAYEMAIILTNSRIERAVLEINVIGPTVRFNQGCIIAITGAECAPKVDGKPVLMWHNLLVRKGSVLRFEPIAEGCRAYLAFRGGIDVPEVLGSRSTFLPAGIGGHEGRALKAGDILPIDCHHLSSGDYSGGCITPSAIPTYGSEHVIRAIRGPQDECFAQSAIQLFFESTYTVTPRSDRTGYRLEGPSIETKAGRDIISQGTVPGAIQITGEGKPLVIMRDGPTVGGYAKIATVISGDINKLAQAKPGDSVRFEEIALSDAYNLIR